MKKLHFLSTMASFLAIVLLPLCIHAQTFVHPGIPFTRNDLDQLKANITVNPWLTAYNSFANDSKSKLTYGMQGPFAVVSRAIDINRTQWESDMVAIHNLALMYVFTGDSAYARKATNMLNAWAVTNTTFSGDESFLDLGDYAKYYVTGADILRSTFPGWTAANTTNVKNWFANVLWPQLDVPDPTRGQNQGAIAIEAAMAIAAFLDDPIKFQQAVASWRNDAGGGLPNSLPNGEVGDAGRDEGHWAGQVQALAWAAEVAWKQGVDLYGDLENRVLATTELYTHFHQDTTGLRYIRFGGPYSPFGGWGSNGTFKRLLETYNIIEGAYVIRKGVSAPWTVQMRNLLGENGYTFLYRKTADNSVAAPLPALNHPIAAAASRLVNADIGNVGLAGSASNSNGLWTLKGAGNIPVPTLTSADACNFAFQKINGDAVIITRVNSIDQSNTAAKAGIMMRDSLGNSGRYVGLFLNAGGGAVVTWRNADAWSKTATSWNNKPGGYQDHYLPAVPYWLKLEKIGTRITAFHSFDGISWTCISSIETAITGAVYAGICVASGNTSSLSTATFTDVQLTNPAPDGSPVITSAAADTATTGNAYSYTITASNTPVNFSATGLPAGLSIDGNTGIISGTPATPGNYLVTLNATNSTGTGSAQLLLTVLSNVAPGAPASLTATQLSNSSIQLVWNASGNTTSYTVKRSLTSGGPYTVIVSGVSGTSYTDANAYPGPNYYIVTALAGSLESAASNEVFLELPPSIPAKPVVTNATGAVNLDWPAATGATTYNIKRSSTSGGPYSVIATVSVPHYTDSNIVNGGYYYYVVSSAAAHFESANSQEVMGVPGSSTNTWSAAAATGNWNTAGNWVNNAVPASPALINFDSSSVSALTNDVSNLEVSRITFNSTAVPYTITGNAITLGNDISNNSAQSQIINLPVTINRTASLNANAGAITLSGVISGTGGIERTGLSQVTLSGANTYSGNTVVTGGPGAGGWPPDYIMAITGVGTGAVGAPLSGPLGTGTVTMNGGSLLNNGTAVIYNDVLVKDSVKSYLYSNAGGLTLAGRLIGAGTIEHDGNSTNGLQMNGDNSEFTGTFISVNRSSNHRIRFNNASAGSAKANWIFNNGFTDGQGFTFTGTIRFGALSGSGQLRRDNGTPVISVGALNTNTTFSGVMTLGLNLLKEGTGVFRLTATNNYSGSTTVTAGTLLIDSTGSITSATTVNGGTLGGIGTVKNTVTVGTGSGTGAVLAPGSQGIGTFTSTALLTMNTDAVYAFEMSSTGDSADKMVAANVTLNNPVLQVTDVNPGNVKSGASYTILDNTGTSAITGTFKNLPEMAMVTISGVDFRITYKGGTGNDVVLFDNRNAPALITSADSAVVVEGRSFTYTVTAINNPTSFSATGLPAGLTIDAATGIISGTPTESGVFAVTLGTTNVNGTATRILTLTVQSNIVAGVLVASGDARDIVEWNAITGMNYAVKRATTAGGPYTTLATTAATRYVDSTGVTNGSTYYYVVAAVDSTVESSNSAEVVAKPNWGQFGYFAFDESGSKGIDAWGANHAALAATAKRDTGLYKTALKLDGTATAYATLPTGEVSTLNDFTIATWVKMDAISTWMRVFDFGSGTATYMFLTPQAAFSNGKSTMRYAIKYNGSAEQAVTYADTFPLNTWRHLAITQSGNTCSMYINGKLVAANTNVTFKPATLGSTTQNYIGKSQWNDPQFKGSIEDFRIYSRALSATEIAAALQVEQAISFDSLAAKTIGDSDYVATVSASSALPVTLSSSDTTVAKIVNGTTIHLVAAGTATITASQVGNTRYKAAPPVSRVLTINKKTQLITFDSIPTKLIGDSDFVLAASASSLLPLRFTSSNTAVATVNNGVVHIMGAGSAEITAMQDGSDSFRVATAVRTLNVRPLLVKVLSKDGDSGQTNNTSIKPYLQINNEDQVAINYNELTARYWFTAENYAGINTWIDYAQLGSNVKMKYVALDTPRNGALGYVEYSFAAAAGKLAAAGNSGVIQSRIANADYSILNEGDDYSYTSNLAYTANSRITLYRNGLLVWGTEPAKTTAVIALKAYSQPKSSAANTISSNLQINNEGNTPVNYRDISVRYWFTEDGTAGLQYWIDYAKLGATKITGSFGTVSPVVTSADHYMEFRIDSSAGALYPLSNTGLIQWRMAKTDWSGFTQTNDHSYLNTAALSANDHITVYYKGQLVYGVEPGGSIARIGSDNKATAEETVTGSTVVKVYPNPVMTNLTISTGKVESDALVQVYDELGALVLTRRISSTATVIAAESWKAGVYWLRIINGKKITMEKIVKL